MDELKTDQTKNAGGEVFSPFQDLRKKRNFLAIAILITLIAIIALSFVSYQLGLTKKIARFIPPPFQVKYEVSPNADTSLFFEPEKPSVKANSVLPLMIKVNSGKNTLTGIEVALKFDPEFLEGIEIMPSDFFQPTTILNEKVNNSAGTILFSLICPIDQPRQGEGNLILINFKARKSTRGKTTPVEFLPQSQAAAIGEKFNVIESTQKATIRILEE